MAAGIRDKSKLDVLNKIMRVLKYLSYIRLHHFDDTVSKSNWIVIDKWFVVALYIGITLTIFHCFEVMQLLEQNQETSESCCSKKSFEKQDK